MKRENYTRINKEAWEEAAPIHAGEHRLANLLVQFKEPGFSTLSALKTSILLDHGVEGKSVFQPCCHNGRELLSIKNLGAGNCVGFDLSEEFVHQARQLKTSSGIDCSFVHSDVYDIGPEYNASFEIAYISAGTFMWLPDLDGFFAVVSRLLRPGGWVFMIDQHPVLDMYGMEPTKERKRFKESYFRTEPYKITHGLDYYRSKPFPDSKPCFRFHHKLSDIVNACVCNDLAVDTLEELETAEARGYFQRLEKKKYHLPLSFIMTAIRK